MRRAFPTSMVTNLLSLFADGVADRKRQIWGLVILLSSHVFCLAGVGNLDVEILGIMDKYQSVGVSAVVVKNNKIVYTRSFGYNPDYNDSTLRMAIPTDGVYVIQSISKSFIGTAIMQLVEKKQLKLDDDVNLYLPFVVRNPHFPDVPITVRMLLSHRSTINDRHYGWTFDQINPQTGKKWKECYNACRPGTMFSYCNLNYNLLGAIIEDVTEVRFFDYIDEYIIKPLGVYASFNLTKIDSTRLVRSYEYDKKTKSFKKDLYIYNYRHYQDLLKDYQLCSASTAAFSPSGGMKISAVDLAKYMMMHMNYGEYNGKKIISRESELEMWKPQGETEPANGIFSQYGLSFSRWSKIVKGESFIGITGGAHGIHSAMYFNPEKSCGFVIICNGCTSNIKMKEEVMKVLYKYWIAE